MSRPIRSLRLRRLDDEALVERVRDGDDAAFAVLASRHGPWLTRLCTRLLGGDAQTAEDVVQETFVKAHATVLRDHRPLRLRGWLAVVARNGCMDEHRRRRPEPTDVVPEQAHLDADPFAIDPHLEEAWEALTSRHREILHHRELLGLSYDEIATAMDLSVPAVEGLLFRARAALRREYERAGGRLLGCGVLGLQLSRLVDGEARPNSQAAHLASCGDCQEALHRVEQLGGLLRGVPADAATGPGAVLGSWLRDTAARVAMSAATLGDAPTALRGLTGPVVAAMTGATIIGTSVVAMSTPSSPPVDDGPSPVPVVSGETGTPAPASDIPVRTWWGDDRAPWPAPADDAWHPSAPTWTSPWSAAPDNHRPGERHAQSPGDWDASTRWEPSEMPADVEPWDRPPDDDGAHPSAFPSEWPDGDGGGRAPAPEDDASWSPDGTRTELESPPVGPSTAPTGPSPDPSTTSVD